MAKKNNAKDLEDAIERAIDHGLDELGYELEKAYGSSIDRFYNRYEPHYYKRTYSLYAGSDTWDKPIKNKKKLGKHKYYIGMNVGSENIYPNINDHQLPYDDIMSGNSYRDPVDFVFNRAFEQGIHGITPEEASKIGIKRMRSPENPPPKHFMDKDYNRIIEKSHLDEIFGTAISRELVRMK